MYRSAAHRPCQVAAVTLAALTASS